jgi:hypothetical protein
MLMNLTPTTPKKQEKFLPRGETFQLNFFARRLLAKVYLKILNRRQPVARGDEQTVHNFINSTAASRYFCFQQFAIGRRREQ